MAEVRRVVGKMQLDTEGGSVKMQLETEGGSVQVRYETREKIVGSFTGEIGVTKAVLGNEEVTSRFTREIPKEATTRFTREIDVPKAEPLNMAAAGSSTPEIGVAKAWLNKEAGSSTGLIGVTKAGVHKEATRGSTTGFFVTQPQPLNKQVAGGSTRGFLVTKAQPLNKEGAGSFTPEIGVTKAAAGTSTPEIGGIKAGLNKEEAGGGISVTKAALETDEAADAAFRAWMYKFAEGREHPKSEKVVPPVTMTKERMPDAYIQSIMKRPMRRIRPLPDSMYQDDPKLREFLQDTNSKLNYMVDLQEDLVKQQGDKGYAEIGVDYTDGLLKVYILGEVEGN